MNIFKISMKLVVIVTAYFAIVAIVHIGYGFWATGQIRRDSVKIERLTNRLYAIRCKTLIITGTKIDSRHWWRQWSNVPSINHTLDSLNRVREITSDSLTSAFASVMVMHDNTIFHTVMKQLNWNWHMNHELAFSWCKMLYNQGIEFSGEGYAEYMLYQSDIQRLYRKARLDDYRYFGPFHDHFHFEIRGTSFQVFPSIRADYN